MDLFNPKERQIYEELKHVIEPKIKMSVIDLGLVYNIKVEKYSAKIEITLPSLASPFGEYLQEEIRNRILLISGIKIVQTQVVWFPRWNFDLMAGENSKNKLGIYY
ncbi:metal-sulfur cluster assembly factor [Leptospira stimsonii]|uniref:Metal-sulfur cluster biosynthetic enzyme n=1 Tax=Leptospira stimsonii TaxID=2202203 RepID=A0A396YV56_9LEPT|nr:iron-sulfur cluster assembly protein [Leptospira stimsonii]RHX84750.1 metal-sulfur cluster biosynthetic enzyme [Leptospira stimsonii]